MPLAFFLPSLGYMIPVVVATSLVYGAAQHESTKPILIHSWRAGVWMVGFMVSIFAVLRVCQWLWVD